jgi:hypothetical protein
MLANMTQTLIVSLVVSACGLILGIAGYLVFRLRKARACVPEWKRPGLAMLVVGVMTLMAAVLLRGAGVGGALGDPRPAVLTLYTLAAALTLVGLAYLMVGAALLANAERRRHHHHPHFRH